MGIQHVLYPTIMGGALFGYLGLVESGFPPGPVSYGIVAIAIALIMVAEKIWPERLEWRAGRSETAHDVAYLFLVQILLPLGLALLATLGLSAIAHRWGALGVGLWPHHWPLLAQLLLMKLVAEFFRYWLHRLSHTWAFLWRFHAVHHSPRILYTLNVGRFHPVDKSLQFVADALPFIVLGVGPAVLSLYFLLYAVNGFFQHSNCRVRLGPFNWVVAGPELHRWHHSLLPSESNNNYGNNLIVWDVIFGSRFLPKDRHVRELGIPDPDYPTDFARQLLAPLTRNGSGT